MLDAIRADLAIIRERDPAARGTLEILLCYPGFHALVLASLSHRIWTLGSPAAPLC
jgi:serine O-acetyltransferase